MPAFGPVSEDGFRMIMASSFRGILEGCPGCPRDPTQEWSYIKRKTRGGLGPE